MGGAVSLTVLWLILNNHTLRPSISDCLHYLVFSIHTQENHISSNQTQFANTLYTA